MSSIRAKVYVRIRPTNDSNNMIYIRNENTEIGIHLDEAEYPSVGNNQICDWSFNFNKIFENASQQELYNETTKNIVDDALNGYNGVIMCYGQTGSGKTYTMYGATEKYENRGIVPRVLSKLFEDILKSPQSNIIIRISYFEIYNDQIVDLLKNKTLSKNVAYQVVDDEIGTYIKGMSYLPVKSEEDALYLLFEGELNRTRRPHSLNKNSSRSHCVYTIYIESHDPGKENANYSLSKINFVDLAGSERIGKSEVTGESKVEAIYINKSLSFLEQTVIAMVNKSRNHVPYRQSTLTNYLQDSLNGKSNVVLIANIWDEMKHAHETISTLRFSSRMMKIPVKAVKSEIMDVNTKVKNLLEEIKILKNELYMHDSFVNKPIKSYDEVSEQQKIEIFDKADKFLKGDIQEIEIHNLRQVQSYFQAFQKMWSLNKTIFESNINKSLETTENTSMEQTSVSKKSKYSRGNTKATNEKIEIEFQEPSPTPSEAFEEYKLSEGKELYEVLVENKEIKKKLRNIYTEDARKLNALKMELEDITAQINNMAQEREENEGLFYGPDGEEIITRNEYYLIKNKKDLKESYYGLYEAIRNTKLQIAHTNTFVSKCREKILKEFEMWYESQFNSRPEMMNEFDIPMSLNSYNEKKQEIQKFNDTKKKVNNRRMCAQIT